MIAVPPAIILTEVANQDKDIMKLVQESMKRAQAQSIPDLLSKIQPCAGSDFESGRVNESHQRRFFLLSRDIEEPNPASEIELKQYYSERMQAVLPREISLASVGWKFEPDFIVGRSAQQNRQICLQSNLSPEDTVETLVHEMVHFTRPDEQAPLDMTKDSGSLAYAMRAVNEKGDEVDAYLLQYSLHIRRQGKKSLPHLRELGGYFNDQGQFIAERVRLAKFVVEDMGYFRKRFSGEYKSLLGELQSENQQRQIGLEQTSASRQDYIADAENFLKTRWKVLNWIWPKYRQETERVQKFLNLATVSRNRLALEASQVTRQAQLLREKLKGL
jgi:hypothetical protein